MTKLFLSTAVLAALLIASAVAVPLADDPPASESHSLHGPQRISGENAGVMLAGASLDEWSALSSEDKRRAASAMDQTMITDHDRDVLHFGAGGHLFFADPPPEDAQSGGISVARRPSHGARRRRDLADTEPDRVLLTGTPFARDAVGGEEVDRGV